MIISQGTVDGWFEWGAEGPLTQNRTGFCIWFLKLYDSKSLWPSME